MTRQKKLNLIDSGLIAIAFGGFGLGVGTFTEEQTAGKKIEALVKANEAQSAKYDTLAMQFAAAQALYPAMKVSGDTEAMYATEGDKWCRVFNAEWVECKGDTNGGRALKLK